jgi:hypothetical protein
LIADQRPILNYSALRASSPSDFEIQEADGQVRVLFPLLPRWIYLVLLAAALGLGVLFIWGAIQSLISMWQIRGIAFQFSEWAGDETGNLIRALLCLAVVALCCLAYRQWTRDVEVLVATPAGLLWSKRGLLGRRSCWWPVQEIAAIELRQTWGAIAITGAVRFLVVRLRDGCRQRFLLRSGSRRLPQTIAERLAAVLQCPLV